MNTLQPIELYLNNQIKISTHRLKRKLFNAGLKERKCEECNSTTWQNMPLPLELHHVDGNRLNNNLSNLQMLCPNCHALTTNFRASNRKRKDHKHNTFEEYKAAIENSYTRRQACIRLGIVAYGGNYTKLDHLIAKYDLKLKQRTQEEIDTAKEQSRINTQALNRASYYKKKNKYASLAEANMAARKVKNRPSKDELLLLIWKQPIQKLSKELKISDVAIRSWVKRYNIPNPPPGYWRKYATNRLDECNKIKDDLFAKFHLDK
jgi:hypothetical protein